MNYNIIYKYIYIFRNLATQRENIYVILNYANEILVLCYAIKAYRDINIVY